MSAKNPLKASIISKDPIKPRMNTINDPISTETSKPFTFKKIKEYMIRKPKSPRYF